MDENVKRCANCGDPRSPAEDICDKCGSTNFVGPEDKEGYALAEEKEKQKQAFAAGKGMEAAEPAKEAAPKKEEKPAAEEKKAAPKKEESKDKKKKK